MLPGEITPSFFHPFQRIFPAKVGVPVVRGFPLTGGILIRAAPQAVADPVSPFTR